jgi:hypothetical protein
LITVRRPLREARALGMAIAVATLIVGVLLLGMAMLALLVGR